ncbi:MAG: L,D-transpeptidase [Xanthomonadaceae bacterium]|nr:L,D-transpeptidase [Xanthomonadaceae bacterium]
MRMFVLVLLLTVMLPSQAVPFWGAKQSSPADTPPGALLPGEWIWGGDSKAMGPMAVVVSLTEQRAYAYRNGLLVGVTTVSTGKPGHETPTGVFTILQKDKDHHSSKYNNAAMPYQERLTWDGVALHAGGLPGYPESHGCVHLPSEFARLLFNSTTMGMVVVIAKEGEASPTLVHPVAISPINPMTGAEESNARLGANEQFRWEPEKAPQGMLSLILSTADRRIFVYRDGIEIGRARVEFKGGGLSSGTHAYLVAAGGKSGQMPPWIRIGIPGKETEAGQQVALQDVSRVVVPRVFAERVIPMLTPGVVLLQTDSHVLPQTTGAKLQVLNANPPSL